MSVAAVVESPGFVPIAWLLVVLVALALVALLVWWAWSAFSAWWSTDGSSNSPLLGATASNPDAATTLPPLQEPDTAPGGNVFEQAWDNLLNSFSGGSTSNDTLNAQEQPDPSTDNGVSQ